MRQTRGILCGRKKSHARTFGAPHRGRSRFGTSLFKSGHRELRARRRKTTGGSVEAYGGRHEGGTLALLGAKMVREREDTDDGWAKELKTIEYSIEDEEDSNARARFKLGVENQAEATEENLAFEMDQVHFI